MGQKMQWLFDVVIEMMEDAGFIRIGDVELYLKGMIVIWSGNGGDIPDGWALCNGTLGTPNLTRRFVIGPGPGFAPHATGGAFTHRHDFTGDGHRHTHPPGARLATGTDFGSISDFEPAVGTTDLASSLPPYYALAFIMKL